MNEKTLEPTTTNAPVRQPMVARHSRQDPERWLNGVRTRDSGAWDAPPSQAIGVSADGAVVLPGDAEVAITAVEVTAELDGATVRALRAAAASTRETGRSAT